MFNMNNKNLNIAILSKLTCTSCTDQVVPPIMGCANDHLLCNKCVDSNAVCPKPCNERIMEKPIINQIARCLKYPCKYYCGSTNSVNSNYAYYEIIYNFYNKPLNDVVLNKLKCISCPRTVIPPFFGCSKDHIVCNFCISSSNTCPSSCKEPLVAKPKLDDIAKVLCYICFYCCGGMYASEEIALHESTCEELPPLCPMANCKVPLNIKNMFDHFICLHDKNVIVRSPTETTAVVPFVRGPLHYDVSLVVYDSQIMFYIYTSYEDNFVNVVVKHTDIRNIMDEYVIQYKNKFTEVKSFGLIFPKDNMWEDYQVDRKYCVKIPLEHLNFGKIFISFDRITSFTEHIVARPNPKEVDNDVLINIRNKFECPVCMKIMRLPIYLCWMGHSICCQCKAKLANCPTCRISYSIRYKKSTQPSTDLQRNYFLEDIIDGLRKDKLLINE